MSLQFVSRISPHVAEESRSNFQTRMSEGRNLEDDEDVVANGCEGRYVFQHIDDGDFVRMKPSSWKRTGLAETR